MKYQFGNTNMRRSFVQRVLSAGAVTSALCAMTIAAMPTEAEVSVGDVRNTLEQWVETRRVISKEQRDWALGKEMLEDRIGLVQREIDSLQKRITDAEASIAEADVKRLELLVKNDTMKSAASSLERTVEGLEARTRLLLTKLPDPIREGVTALSQRIPDGTVTPRQSLGERFQNVVGVLNQVNKFNREITVTSEVRELESGVSAEVTALYLGIGQSYFAATHGDAAGVGRPGDEGWTWTASNVDAANIRAAIATFRNEQPAAFVLLPVTIQD